MVPPNTRPDTSASHLSKQQRSQPQLPTDLLPVIAALQVTLELDELLSIFLDQIRRYIAVDGLNFHNEGQGYSISLEKDSRHKCNYNLKLMETTIGDITFSRSRRFNENELGILEHLLGLLLHPLRNCLNYHKALSVVEHDPLTGILNRAALEKALPREMQLAARTDSTLSLLVIDLDHFKRVNDSYGHLIGDSVLQYAARQMEKVLRSSDLLFRFGGEEFVALLSHTDVEGAYVVAERIRRSISENAHDCESGGNGKPTVSITASIGVAEYHDDDSYQQLFDKADKAVYQAKSEGRNRTVIYKD